MGTEPRTHTFMATPTPPPSRPRCPRTHAFALPPKSKSKTGFFGVRKKLSGDFGAEFQCDGYRYWIGMFESVDMAAHVYDIAAWRFGRPRHVMNFPEIETQVDVELIV